MSDDNDAVTAALREAAKAFCICDGECYETRHGMMNGPCEAMVEQAAAAVAAFLRASAPGNAITPIGCGSTTIEELAVALDRAARGGE